MTAIDDRTTRLTAIPPTTAGPAPMMATATATAATYLRVSTREQAERDGEPEGYSLPAQREANRRKAEALGATIVDPSIADAALTLALLAAFASVAFVKYGSGLGRPSTPESGEGE